MSTISFLFDITDKNFKDEKEFNDLLQHYPDESVLFVTRDQKYLVSAFSGNSTRYLPGEKIVLDSGLSFAKRDILTYDSVDGSFHVVSKLDLKEAENESLVIEKIKRIYDEYKKKK